jgi:hypothetical protein
MNRSSQWIGHRKTRKGEFRFLGLFVSFVGAGLSAFSATAADPIDREALVRRHAPVVRAIDAGAALSVGNGQFAFTVDVTGLQSFQEHYYANGMPLEMLARWAWHENPNPHGYTLPDASEVVATHGRAVSYPTRQNTPAGMWLRENPHIHPLGQLSFVDADHRPLTLADIGAIDQTLDLWRGEIRSRFTWRGELVDVSTVAHPELDGLAIRIRSAAVSAGELRVALAYPRGHDIRVKNTPPLDWSSPESHTTQRTGRAHRRADFERRRDELGYHASLAWSAGVELRDGEAPHTFVVTPVPSESDVIELQLFLSASPLPAHLPDGDATRAAAARHWERFWRSGGAIDFSGSTDPRAPELERRVVLSQYLTAIQFGGPTPPAETGLTASSWYGKHHTEMVWWHMAHFALWGREHYVENALDWFKRTLPAARELAQFRGLEGARWAKMVGPDGRESPGGVPFIIWNQPHPIALAELVHRAKPTRDTLERWREVVLESAACMASMLAWNESEQRYDLGPPLWLAQEIYPWRTAQNPTFELAYWAYALEVAQQWRERLGLGREPDWDHRIRHLAPLPIRHGRYVSLASTPDTWDNIESRRDHPTMLAPLGLLPGGPMVDRATMERTLEGVLTSWQWEAKIWGWDYPMIAMTAARLGEPEHAVDILLKDASNNRYTISGHCPQRRDLAVYLPANGSLLSAVAMMAAGWDGAPEGPAPGFPRDGWRVRSEGVRRLP